MNDDYPQTKNCEYVGVDGECMNLECKNYMNMCNDEFDTVYNSYINYHTCPLYIDHFKGIEGMDEVNKEETDMEDKMTNYINLKTLLKYFGGEDERIQVVDGTSVISWNSYAEFATDSFLLKPFYDWEVVEMGLEKSDITTRTGCAIRVIIEEGDNDNK